MSVFYVWMCVFVKTEKTSLVKICYYLVAVLPQKNKIVNTYMSNVHHNDESFFASFLL